MAQAPWCRERPPAHQRGARGQHRAVTPRGRRVNAHSLCPSPSGGVGGPSGRGGRLRPPGSLANQRGLRDRLCRYPPRERTPWGKAQDAASAPWPGKRLRPPGAGCGHGPPAWGAASAPPTQGAYSLGQSPERGLGPLALGAASAPRSGLRLSDPRQGRGLRPPDPGSVLPWVKPRARLRPPGLGRSFGPPAWGAVFGPQTWGTSSGALGNGLPASSFIAPS